MDLNTNYIYIQALLIKKALKEYKKSNINYKDLVETIKNHTDRMIDVTI